MCGEARGVGKYPTTYRTPPLPLRIIWLKISSVLKVEKICYSQESERDFCFP